MDDHEAMELQIAQYRDTLERIKSYFAVMGTPTEPQLLEIKRLANKALAYDPRDEEEAYQRTPQQEQELEIGRSRGDF